MSQLESLVFSTLFKKAGRLRRSHLHSITVLFAIAGVTLSTVSIPISFVDR